MSCQDYAISLKTIELMKHTISSMRKNYDTIGDLYKVQKNLDSDTEKVLELPAEYWDYISQYESISRQLEHMEKKLDRKHFSISSLSDLLCVLSKQSRSVDSAVPHILINSSAPKNIQIDVSSLYIIFALSDFIRKLGLPSYILQCKQENGFLVINFVCHKLTVENFSVDKINEYLNISDDHVDSGRIIDFFNFHPASKLSSVCGRFDFILNEIRELLTQTSSDLKAEALVDVCAPSGSILSFSLHINQSSTGLNAVVDQSHLRAKVLNGGFGLNTISWLKNLADFPIDCVEKDSLFFQASNVDKDEKDFYYYFNRDGFEFKDDALNSFKKNVTLVCPKGVVLEKNTPFISDVFISYSNEGFESYIKEVRISSFNDASNPIDVLYVEDSHKTRSYMKVYFDRKDNINLVAVSCISEAYFKIHQAEGKFDFIVVDLGLSNGDIGEDFVLNLPERYKLIPCIAYTAHITLKDVALSRGFVDLVEKPMYKLLINRIFWHLFKNKKISV